MSNNVFEIKYLFELYPNIDFTEEFVLSQTITKIETEYNSQATSDAWSHIFDSVHNKRHIQTTVKDKYEVKFVLARNIDINRIPIAYTSLTTSEGETFIIYDVKLTSESVSGTLEYFYTLTFYKNSDEIINHLSNDNALDYTSIAKVNTLEFTVNNPGYVQQTNIIYVAGSPNMFTFTFEVNDLTDNISVNQYMYAHVNDSSFDNETHYYCQCTAKTSSLITFKFLGTTATTSDFDNVEITINHEASIDTTSNVIDKTIDLVIYTFINPKITNVRTQEDGISSADGTEENQSINSKYLATFKVWLKTSDLYLIEYLDYALYNEIIFNLADDTSIVPIQVKGISSPKENNELIDLHEFDIMLYYNNQTVNIFR